MRFLGITSFVESAVLVAENYHSGRAVAIPYRSCRLQSVLSLHHDAKSRRF
jgi:hypothetical protein